MPHLESDMTGILCGCVWQLCSVAVCARGRPLLIEVAAFLELLVQLTLGGILQDEVNPRLHAGHEIFAQT